jgi:hypothetical protein
MQLPTSNSTPTAREFGGFIWQVMQDRGLRSTRPQIDRALQELDVGQLSSVHQAALALSRGADNAVHFDYLAALRAVSTPAFRERLQLAGVEWQANSCLRSAMDDASREEFARLRAQLLGHDLEARAIAQSGLAQMLGIGAPSEASADAVGQRLSSVTDPPLDAVPTPSRPEGQPGRPSISRPRQIKIYGSSSALTIELSQLPGEGSSQWVVMVEGALSLRSEHGGFDWSNKVVFQVGVHELPAFLAVVLGWQTHEELRFHGHRKDKSLLLSEQAHGLYLELRQTARKVGVPITRPDRYALGMLVLEAMTKNEPGLTSADVLAVAKAVWLPQDRVQTT